MKLTRIVKIRVVFLPTYFVECRRTILELNSQAPYPSTVREIKFRRCLFTSLVKREIRYVHVVVVQNGRRNVQKSMVHVQSCCFANQSYCFFYVLVTVRVVGS